MFPSKNYARPILVGGAMLLCVTASGAQAQQATATELSGLWLTTDYPEITESLGDEIKLDLSLSNRNLPPRRVELGVDGLPDGWAWEISGSGKPVTAAMVAPDDHRTLRLKVTPPKDAKAGVFDFNIRGQSESDRLDLPISLKLTEAEPAKLTLEAKLPALRGSPARASTFRSRSGTRALRTRPSTSSPKLLQASRPCSRNNTAARN